MVKLTCQLLCEPGLCHMHSHMVTKEVTHSHMVTREVTHSDRVTQEVINYDVAHQDLMKSQQTCMCQDDSTQPTSAALRNSSEDACSANTKGS